MKKDGAKVHTITQPNKTCSCPYHENSKLKLQKRCFFYGPAAMDSARSWTVAAACCWMNVFGFGIVRSAGVFYVGILDTFCVTREQASWPVNLSIVCYMTAGPFVGVLARYIAIWKLMLAGSVVGSLAVSTCFWAQSLTFLNALLGFIHGTSISCLLLFVVIINQHFCKYKAMASGISHAGFSAGAIIFSPLTQVLLGEYGLRGSLLLSGAIMLNSAAGAFLQRSPPVIIPKRAEIRLRLVQPTESGATKKKTGSFTDSDVICQLQETGKNTLVDQNINVNKREDADRNHSATETLLSYDETLTVEPTRKDGKSRTEHQHSQTPELSSEQTEGDRDSAIMKCHNESSKTRLFSFVTFPRFYLITSSQILVFFIMNTYTTIVVDFAVDVAISRWGAISLVSLYNAADMVARIGSGWITDRGFLKKSTMMALHFSFWAVCLFLTPFSSAYSCQVLLSTVAGWCTGCTMILIVVFFVELVGIDNLGITFGVSIFLSGAFGLLRPSLIGYFRDHHGNYRGLFNVLAISSGLMSILWFSLTIKEKISQVREKDVF